MSGAIGKILIIGLAAKLFDFAAKNLVGRAEQAGIHVPGMREFILS